MSVTLMFLSSNFCHVLNVVCFLLGNSPASVMCSDAGELPRRKHMTLMLSAMSYKLSKEHPSP